MIINSITTEDIKKIFSNTENKKLYLRKLFYKTGNSSKIEVQKGKLDQQIIESWSYEESKSIIREMFRNHPKFIEQQKLDVEIDKAINDWNTLNLGDFEWPFSAMSFDQHVHTLNRNKSLSEQEKDDIISKETIKFRRIKQINSLRNDFIESLIFKNENIIPTLGNNKGVDFYINGEPYDQKVGKSVGKAFIKEYGQNYREIALANPELVAKSLYKNQDEERFGDEPRLLIVYLDSDVNSQSIQKQLDSIDFSAPYDITFDYKHSNNIVISHKTKCFVILLHN
ncbi:MAG: hypothetical protein IKK49_03295 [Clostridia bacterium]|nr:hypothetical protein [Clostridia bacterium]